MKKVTIKQLQLTNFKGIRSLTINFYPEQTIIAGDNATGKTTIFDAFTWCLFGKDSQDRTAFGIKTVDKEGKTIERIEHEVTAIIDVGGWEHTFTRILTEDWGSIKGEAQTKLKGNTTHYLIDGIEIKAKDYADRIAGIIDEQLFKLITNPSYFPSLPWQTQRNTLITIAGNVTYQDIAKGNKDFETILREMSGKEMAEFKEAIAYRIKKVKEELDKCPIEINAIESVTPEAPDFAALEAEAKKINFQIEQIDKAQADAAEAARQRYEEQRKKQDEIYKLQNERDRIIHEATREHNKLQEEKNEERRKLLTKKESIEREIEFNARELNQKIDHINSKIELSKQRIAEKDRILADLREKWKEENAKEYVDSDQGLICPVYNIICKDDTATAKFAEGKGKEREAFNLSKSKKLDEINERGRMIKEEKAEEEKHLKELEKELEEKEKEAKVTREEAILNKQQIEEQINSLPEQKNEPLDVNTLPEVIAIDEKIISLKAEIVPETEDTSRDELAAKKRELENQRREIEKQLNVRETIKTNKAKIEAIIAREKVLAQQKADLDRQEYTADQLQMKFMNEIERRVNSLFKLVNFKMYEKQINGGDAPTCVATMGGVKYSDLNGAARINAGLDIINTLCNFHQVTAPIFVDNAESINEIIPTQSQIIKLVVSHDKELRISNQ